jgi:hypothetical protein
MQSVRRESTRLYSISLSIAGSTRMGTWGLETFEDDIASDWLEDLYESDPIAFFKHCLDHTRHDNLESLACVGVVCTAEIIHAVIREPRQGLPEVVHHWLDENKGLDVFPLIPGAIEGLRRVIGPHSQMHQLWEDDAERYDGWKQRIGDLLNRLELALAEIV